MYRLLFKFYLLIIRCESLRWLPVRRWIVDRLLCRKHVGLKIHANVYIHGWWALTLGDRVTINHGCELVANGGLMIGDDVMVAHACSIITTEHGYSGSEPMRDQPISMHPVRIGNDVWVGARSIILGGTQLQNGTIVGAGSVVKGQFEPFSIIAGVPAKTIKERH